MQTNSNSYPHYKKNLELPKGLYPPIDGYTHQELISEICYNICVFLVENKINHIIAKKQSLYFVQSLTDFFEKEYLEYKISTYANKNYDDKEFKSINLKRLAENCGTITTQAIQSKLNDEAFAANKNLHFGILNVAYKTIKERILTLSFIEVI